MLAPAILPGLPPTTGLTADACAKGTEIEKMVVSYRHIESNSWMKFWEFSFQFAPLGKRIHVYEVWNEQNHKVVDRSRKGLKIFHIPEEQQQAAVEDDAPQVFPQLFVRWKNGEENGRGYCYTPEDLHAHGFTAEN